MTSQTLDAPHSPSSDTSKEKRYLNVQFEHKELAKRHGARWDANVKRWYYPRGSRLELIYSWRVGAGIGGRILLNVPASQHELAYELGVGFEDEHANMKYRSVEKSRRFHVKRGSDLYTIYSWRPDFKPLPRPRRAPRPVYTVPSLPGRGAFNPDTANAVPGHTLRINPSDNALARALGIRTRSIRNEVLEGSWYERILSWCEHTIRKDSTAPHALTVPDRDQGLAEYLGAEPSGAGWQSIPGSTLHTALNWRTHYVPRTETGAAA